MLFPHKPDDYSTIQIPISWNPTADYSPLKDWLAQVMPTDCIEMVQQIIGYCCSTITSVKKFFVVVGPRDAGKTTFLVIVQRLVGWRNFELIDLKDFSENRFAPAKLENKILAVHDDIAKGRLKDTAMIKTLTGGGGTIIIERKCENSYKAPLYAKLLYACNKVPTATDKSDAWLDRVCLIPMTHRIVNKDPSVMTRLTSPGNLEAAFRFAMEGLKVLLENNMQLPEPVSVKNARLEYASDNDTVMAFMVGACERVQGILTARSLLYSDYVRWCEAMGLRFVLGKKAFYDRLRELGIREKKTADNRFFVDVRLSAIGRAEIGGSMGFYSHDGGKAVVSDND